MFTIIIKGTNGCNLDCSYCSLGKKIKCEMADKDMLFQIMKFACEQAKKKKENSVTVILHGGEPTLIDLNNYAYAIEQINSEYNEMKIEYSMQTNAWNISDEYLEFLNKYKVNVGVSIDGPKEVHDIERKSCNGAETFETVCCNIDRMLDAGISVSCLMVLTSLALKSDFAYLDFFSQRNLHLKINPLLNYGEVYDHPELSLEKKQYAEYLIKAYEYVIENSTNVTISPIDNILKAVLSDGKIYECTFNPVCNRNFVCVDHLGNIYPCGKYSDLNGYKIGNIFDKSLFSLNQSDTIRELIERRTVKLPKECTGCKYVAMCNAGCNAEASIDGDIGKPPLLCEDYKMLFGYFSHDGLLLYKTKLEQRREELLKYGV